MNADAGSATVPGQDSNIEIFDEAVATPPDLVTSGWDDAADDTADTDTDPSTGAASEDTKGVRRSTPSAAAESAEDDSNVIGQVGVIIGIVLAALVLVGIAAVVACCCFCDLLRKKPPPVYHPVVGAHEAAHAWAVPTPPAGFHASSHPPIPQGAHEAAHAWAVPAPPPGFHASPDPSFPQGAHEADHAWAGPAPDACGSPRLPLVPELPFGKPEVPDTSYDKITDASAIYTSLALESSTGQRSSVAATEIATETSLRSAAMDGAASPIDQVQVQLDAMHASGLLFCGRYVMGGSSGRRVGGALDSRCQ